MGNSKTPLRCRVAIALLVPVLVLAANQPWNKEFAAWTGDDARHVLENSPWAQPASASFGSTDTPEPAPMPLPGPAEAGMAGAKGVSDGRWDGGIGRNVRGGVPSLSILIRWDSALPVRQALMRTPNENSYTPAQFEKDYILTIIGLVPAGRYRSGGRLSTQSKSEDTMDPQDPEEMLEGIMATSRLAVPGKRAIVPDDVKLDAATGSLHLFFPRTISIDTNDKEVFFSTRFGSMTVGKKFRIKDLMYKGKLDL